ncbi:T-box-containing protein TBX6L-like isoform X2 [Leptopilina heterotoma]|nr:T-box-containing protein TBX6L-like isoform X2 [Leptopilina heterotoma]
MSWQHPIYNQDFYHRPEFTAGHNFWFPQSTLGSGPQLTEDVKVELQSRKLWSKFHGENTEMIITKSGRRMFPAVQVCVSGLQKRARYVVILEIAPATNRRHKYVTDGNLECNNIGKISSTRGWTSAGPAEPQPPQNRRIYMHPDGPATGAHWMQHPINFSKLKITNNAVDPHSHVVLTSMHKYIPKIWIIRCDDHHRDENLNSQPCKAFSFPETEFIAVTAYQNENITRLKINNNPFAKGFRETGQSRCKRKLQTSEDQSSLDSHDEEGNVSSSDCEAGQLEDSPECSANKRTRRSPSDTESVIYDSGISSSGGATPPPSSSSSSQLLSSETLSEVNFRVSSSSSSASSSVSLSPAPTEHAGNQTRLYRPWADSPSSPSSPCRSQEQVLPVVTTPMQYHSLFFPLLAPEQQLAALEYSRLQQIQRFQSNLFLSKLYH